MDFRVLSRNISENMHARCMREDTKQALKGNLQADGVQSRQTLFVRYCPGITPQSACVVLPLLYRFSVKSARWLCKICVKNKLHFVEAGEGSLTSWKMFWAIPHMKKSISTRCFFYILMLFSPEKSSVTVDLSENAPAGRLPFPHSAAGR